MAGGTGAELTLSGLAVVPTEGQWAADGNRSVTRWVDSPLWPLLAHVENDGGWLRDRVTVIQGPSAHAGDVIEDALVLRLTDHLLDSLGPVLADQLGGDALSAGLGGGAPVASLIAADLYVDDVALEAMEISTLDFRDDGLAWGASIIGLDAALRFDFPIPFVPDEYSTMFIESLVVGGRMVFGADELGGITVTAQDTDIQINGLVLFGLDDPTGILNNLANLFLNDMLEPMIEDMVVGSIASALEVQAELRVLEYAGVLIKSDFTMATHDADGVNLYADSHVETPTSLLTGLRLANPTAQARLEGYQIDGAPYGLGLMLDDDLLSALGAGMFEAGLLAQTVGAEDTPLPLTTTLMSTFSAAWEELPPGLPVTIVTSPVLGIPASPGAGSPEAARLHVGGLGLDFRADVDGDGEPESQMNVVVDVILGLAAGADLMDISLVDIDATVTSTTLVIEEPAEVEEALSSLFGVLLPGMVSGMMAGEEVVEDEVSALDGLEPVGSGPVGQDLDRAGMFFNVDPATLVSE